MKIRENETGAFNLSASTTYFTNASGTLDEIFVRTLDWNRSKNDFKTDVKVFVPIGEVAAQRNSSVLFIVT